MRRDPMGLQDAASGSLDRLRTEGDCQPRRVVDEGINHVDRGAYPAVDIKSILNTLQDRLSTTLSPDGDVIS
jgi:hypothetical protein